MLVEFLKDCKASDGQTFKAGSGFECKDDDAAILELIESGDAKQWKPDEDTAPSRKAVANWEPSGTKEKDEADAVEATIALEKRLSDVIKKEVKSLTGIESRTPANPHVEITGKVGSEVAGNENFGFKSLGAFKKALYRQANGTLSSHPDDAKQLMAAIQHKATPSGASEGVDSDGGVLVPAEFRKEILNKIYEAGNILGRCRHLPTASNAIQIPFVHETSRADGSRFGGVRGYWRSESAQMTKSKPAFGRLELNLEKLTCLFYATDEFIEDAVLDIGSLTTPMFIQELTFKAEDAIINGTGAGQPLGVLTSGATVSQAKNTSQTAATFDIFNAVKMLSRMWGRSRANAAWVINNDVIPQWFTMTQTMNVPIFPQSTPGTHELQPFLGLPVIVSEHCATLGTVGDVILADFGQYIVAEKASGPDSASSMHLRFDYNEMVFRWTWRLNGAPWWESALTPKNGTATLSPFVSLATRA